MSTISLTTAKPASGSLAKVFARVVEAFAARRASHAFAGLSERELQDIGWGQVDRNALALTLDETPQERRARHIARTAWHRAA
jgi:hypothetical protein